MKNERYKIKIACYMIIFVDDKLLLMKRQGSGFHDGKFSVPSGHLESGETPLEAAARETFEETNLTVTEAEFSSVIYRRVENIPNDDYVDFFFVCRSFTGTPKIMEPNKCSEIILAEIDELQEISMVPYVELAIRNMLNENLEYLTTKETI